MTIFGLLAGWALVSIIRWGFLLRVAIGQGEQTVWLPNAGLLFLQAILIALLRQLEHEYRIGDLLIPITLVELFLFRYLTRKMSQKGKGTQQ